MESDFEAILRAMQPAENLYKITSAMFKSAWAQRLAQAKQLAVSVKRDLNKTDKQIDLFLDRIVEAENPSVINAYEKKIALLEKQKLVMAEKLEKQGKPQHAYDDLFELALKFLSNPWKLWASGEINLAQNSA